MFKAAVSIYQCSQQLKKLPNLEIQKINSSSYDYLASSAGGRLLVLEWLGKSVGNPNNRQLIQVFAAKHL